MDTFGWGPSPGGDLGLLGGGEPSLLIDLDDRTLQCLMGGPSAGFGTTFSGGASGSGGALGEASASAGGKRDAEAAAVDAEDDGEDSTDEGAGGGGGGGRGRGRASKKGKSAADAASVKACREKARREKLNECFEELARLCDPSGKMMRTDRISIVQDAIRAMGALRVENNQLKQLNKFLEERMRQLETARAQVMYQQAMLQQQAAQQQLAMQQAQQAQHAQPGHGAGSSAAAAAAPGAAQPGPVGQQQQQQQLQRQPSGLATAASGAGHGEIQPAPSGALEDAAAAQQQAQQQQQQAQQAQQPQAHMAVPGTSAPAGVVPPGMMLVPVSAAAGLRGHMGTAAAPGGYSQPFFPPKADSPLAAAAGGSGGMASLSAGVPGGGFMMPQAGLAGASMGGSSGGGGAHGLPSLPQVMPADAPPLSWLPAPDISQDQKLRPPAA